MSLSTRTREFNHLLSATLEDPDVPLTEQVWQWQRRDPGNDWVPIPGLPPILSRSKAYYRVAAQDYERELRATVSYRDAYSRSGAPKSEESEATYPVREWWSGSADWFVLERERDSSEEGRVRFRVLVSLRDELEEGEPDPAVGEAFVRGDVGFRACTGPLEARVCVEFPGADLDPGTGPGTGDFGSGSSGTRSSQARDRMSSSQTFSAPVAGADTPLDTGKTYRFTAYLVGPEGQKSPESNEVTVLGLRAEARSGAVELSWDAPAGIEGITGWAYRYKQEGSTWDGDSWQPTGTGATATTVEVGSLTNGVSYERALLGAETGPESFVVSATPGGEPGSVRNPEASGANGQVELSWDAPLSDGGTALTGYEYRQGAYQLSGGERTWSDWTAVPSPEEALPTSLTLPVGSCTTYYFEVRARNAAAVRGLGAGFGVGAEVVGLAVVGYDVERRGLCGRGGDDPFGGDVEPGFGNGGVVQPGGADRVGYA